jgi:hypothetical protein
MFTNFKEKFLAMEERLTHVSPVAEEPNFFEYCDAPVLFVPP